MIDYKQDMKAEITGQKKIDLVRAENRVPRWVLPSVQAGIFLIDAVLAAACFAGAFLLREGGTLFANGWQISPEFAPYAAVMWIAALVRLVMLLYQRVYRLSGAFTYTEEAIKIFKAVAV